VEPLASDGKFRISLKMGKKGFGSQTDLKIAMIADEVGTFVAVRHTHSLGHSRWFRTRWGRPSRWYGQYKFSYG